MTICALIPAYNNVTTAADVVRRVLAYLPVIAVADGPTDGTLESLQSIEDERLTIVSYERNRGKGYALRQGFRKARELGYTHVLTIDSDGQHYPEDIPALVRMAKIRPDAMIIGSRGLKQANMPGKNTFANKFSNFWFCLQTGLRLPDTQTGLRVYPLHRLRGEWLMTNRYEAELLLLVCTAWAGVSFVPVPVRVYYPPQEERVSYFRPARDFTRISLLNTLLCVGALCYGLIGRWWRTVFHSLVFFCWAIYANLERHILHLRYGNTEQFALELRGRLVREIRWFLRSMPNDRYEERLAEGATPIDENKPCILISNHQSLLEVLALMAIHRKVVMIGKDWVTRNIFFGRVAQAMGVITIGEGVENFLPEIEQLVKDGYSIAVFPEGTRSLDGELLRFHRGAFYMAEELHLPIRPIVVKGYIDALQKRPYFVGRPTVISLTVYPEILPDDTSFGTDYRDRTRRLHAFYEEAITKE